MSPGSDRISQVRSISMQTTRVRFERHGQRLHQDTGKCLSSLRDGATSKAGLIRPAQTQGKTPVNPTPTRATAPMIPVTITRTRPGATLRSSIPIWDLRNATGGEAIQDILALLEPAISLLLAGLPDEVPTIPNGAYQSLHPVKPFTARESAHDPAK